MITYRPVTDDDYPILRDAISKNPDHAGRCDANFWLYHEPGTQLFAVEDEKGTLGYIRAENILRIHAEFCPQNGQEDRERMRAGIDEFMARLKKDAKPSYRQIIFDAVSLPLVRFLHQRGFQRSKDEHVCNLWDKE